MLSVCLYLEIFWDFVYVFFVIHTHYDASDMFLFFMHDMFQCTFSIDVH